MPDSVPSVSSTRPYFYLLFAQLAIGAAAIFARFALTGTGPLMVSALRMGIAAIPLLMLSPFRKSPPYSLKHEVCLLFGGCLLGIHFAFWIGSLQYIPVAISTLLVCMTPIWNSLYEVFVQKKRVRKLFWGALFIAIAGLGLTLLDLRDPLQFSLVVQPGHAMRGVILAVLGSLTVGTYLVCIDYVRTTASSGLFYDTQSIITRTFGWAALVLILMTLNAGETFPELNNTQAWLGIFGMAFISQMIGHTLLNSALSFFRPSTIAFVTLLEPVCAGIMASFIFSETLGFFGWLGGGIVLISVGVALKSAQRK